MNPVALQLSKGRPFAPTSWGAFGPHWLWVSTTEAALPVVIPAMPAAVALTASVVSVVKAGAAINVQPAQVVVSASIVDVKAGAAINVQPAQVVVSASIVDVIAHGDIGSYSCSVFMPTAECEVL